MILPLGAAPTSGLPADPRLDANRVEYKSEPRPGVRLSFGPAAPEGKSPGGAVKVPL